MPVIKNAILLERWPALRMYLDLSRKMLCHAEEHFAGELAIYAEQPTSGLLSLLPFPVKLQKAIEVKGHPNLLGLFLSCFSPTKTVPSRATLLRKQRNSSRRHSSQEYIDNRPLAVPPAVQMSSYRPFGHGHRPFGHLGLPLDGETDQGKEEDQEEMQTPHLKLP